MKQIESLINFNLKHYQKPYDAIIEDMLGFRDSSIKIAVLEYGIRGCGKRYPKDKIYLEDIDFFNVISFKGLFYFENLLIFWHRDGIITDIEIYNIEDDLQALKKDYEFIVAMIDEGNAHLLSEGDTVLLGAGLVKGKSKMPNSDRLARCRQFVLKKKYLQEIIDELAYGCRL